MVNVNETYEDDHSGREYEVIKVDGDDVTLYCKAEALERSVSIEMLETGFTKV